MVCECHSITQAAKKSFVTQPAVTAAIRELEKEYQKNGSYLPLSLTFDEPRDYMAVVTSYISGC